MNNKSLAVTAPPSPPTHLIVTRASVSGVTPPVCHAVRASQSELWVVRTSQWQASAPDTRTHQASGTMPVQDQFCLLSTAPTLAV